VKGHSCHKWKKIKPNCEQNIGKYSKEYWNKDIRKKGRKKLG
jgi:hypothetical protein